MKKHEEIEKDKTELRFWKIRISPVFVGMMIIFSFFADFLYLFIVLIFALLHECSHLLVLKHYNKNVKEIYFRPFGISIVMEENNLTLNQEIAVAAAGPVFNLFCLVILVFLNFYFCSTIMVYMIVLNGFLFALNVLPVYPLDGGRILYCLIYKFFSYETTGKIIRVVNFCFLMLLGIMGIYMMYLTSFNLSLILIFIFLFINIILRSPYVC